MAAIKNESSFVNLTLKAKNSLSCSLSFPYALKLQICLPSSFLLYRIYSIKRRSAYLIFVFFGAAHI